VVCKGRKILQVTDEPVEKITFEIIGNTKAVQSSCGISVSGNVSGGCIAEEDIIVDGSIMGGCTCEGDIVVQGDINGGCYAEDITVTGNLFGGIVCDNITVGGDVQSQTVQGDVICKVLKCDKVTGDVTLIKE
jgi:cytoskeletal protein CcmA (bactofilin family)